MQTGHCFFGLTSQSVVEVDIAAASGACVVNSAGRHGDAEHFFEAKCLGAQLHVVVVPASSFAVLVLDGIGCRSKLDEIGHADQSQASTEQPQTADDTVRFFFLRPSLAGMHNTMDVRPFHGVMIVHPQALVAMQGTATRAEEQVIEGSDGLEIIVRVLGCGHVGTFRLTALQDAIQFHPRELLQHAIGGLL